MFKKLNSKIESLFDQDSSHKLALDHSLLEAKNQFKAIDNLAFLENLSYIYSNEIQNEAIENLLNQISCYFEINFIFSKNTNSRHYKCRQAIFFGKTIKNVEAWPNINLPTLPISKVYKTNAVGILKKFELSELDLQNKMTAFLFRLSANCVLMVATDTAEPWAKLKIETLHHTLLKIPFSND